MNNTKDWELYQAGVKYNNSLYGNEKNYYDVIDANLAFSNGDQWRNVKGEGLPKPVFNIIKRVKQFKVASLKSDSVTINIEPMQYQPNDINNTEMQTNIHKTDLANAEIKNVLEKINFDAKSRTLLMDGFDTGDWCLHFFWDNDTEPYKNYMNDIKGSINAEVIDSTNVLFGNPNTRIVEKQPYIIITGRDFVKNLKEEFIKNKGNKELANSIKPDSDTQDMAGDNGKVELDNEEYGKAKYIIKYYKEDGIVYANKSVENMYIYEKKKTGYTYYPIAFNNWEEVKGSYHGRAETTGIIPNQIAINKMFAMVIYHQMLTAFPTAVYDADRVENWTNEIGAQIPITNLQGNSIKNVAGYLEPANMSTQIMNAIELAMQYTKETLGVGDASLGNVTMNNASALIAVQKSNAVPLENVKAAFYEFVEDCGRIVLDMMSTNYGIRPVVVESNGMRNIETFNFDELKNMWLHVKADVGAASYFSEIASLQTLDNLLNTGLIEFIDYLKRVPDEIIPNKQELINDIENKDIYKQALYNLMSQFMSTLDPGTQQYLQGLEPDQMEKEVLTMMGLIGGGESEQVNQNPMGMMNAAPMPENQPVVNENTVAI